MPDTVLGTGDAKVNKRGPLNFEFSKELLGKSNCKITMYSQLLINVQINGRREVG